MKDNRSKIEVWISTAEKERFSQLCKDNSYKMSEIVRRAIEEKIEWLEKKGANK